MQENIALAPYTTFRLGGKARFFVTVKNIDDISEAISFAKEKSLPVFILGGGSNVLVGDEGFAGVVIKIEVSGVEQEGNMITAGAGENWDELVAYAVEKNLWGIENLSGIPGTVGGAVVQNIGAYGAALSEVLGSVEVFDTHEQEIRTLSKEMCNFGYRGSIFKTEEGRYIVLRATLKLSHTPNPKLSYKDLSARFADSSEDLAAIRAAVLEIRKGKFPDISVEGTAGSFFKNPLLSKTEAEALSLKYPEMPFFPTPETSQVKIPIAWLMDKALSLHGTRVGGARVFEKQILVIVASRNASATDVKELASLVQKKVFDQLQIKIEPEVKII